MIFDLSASTRTIRLAAIFQLQHFLSESFVLEAFQQRYQDEDDEECRYYLESGLRKAGATKLQFVLPSAKESGPVSFQDFVKRFLSAGTDEQYQLIRLLPTLKEVDPALFIAAVVKSSQLSNAILVVLSAPEKLFENESAHGFLETFLRNKQPVIVLRALRILANVAPQKALPYLPKLLLHGSMPVRAMAILCLNRICPAEAMRLLGEFLHSNEPSVRGIGLSMLFNFPFEDISGILFELIEENGIPPASVELVAALVKSNPDKRFMALLASHAVRRPGEIPLIEELMVLAGEGLSLSGLELGSPADIQRKYRTEAQKKLTEVLATNLGEGAIAVSPEETKGPVPEEKQVLAGEPAAVSPGFLKTFSGVPAPGERDVIELVQFFASVRDEGPVLEAIDGVRKKKLKDDRILKTLLGFIEHSSDRIRLASMNCLSELAPRQLVPHLPVLACHSSSMVASVAIQKLRQLDGPTFSRRIAEWLRSPGAQGKKAAIIALTQMDFAQARRFIFPAMEQSSDLKLIEGLGNILLMNPERNAFYEVQKLAERAPSSKKDLLWNLADGCKANFQEIAAPPTLDLEGKAEAILLQIRRISYQVQQGYSFETLISEAPGIGVVVVVLILAGLWFLWRGLAGGADVLQTSQSKTPVITKLKVPPKGPLLPEGTMVAGILAEFDPFNHYWKFKALDGSEFKVIFPKGTSRLSLQESLIISVSPRQQTLSGYQLYHVISFKRKTGNEK